MRPSGREDRGQENEAPLRYHVFAGPVESTELIAGLLVSFTIVKRYRKAPVFREPSNVEMYTLLVTFESVFKANSRL